MTVIVRPVDQLPARPDLLRRTVTGTPAEVAATLAMVRDRGYLVAATAPRQVHNDPRRVTATVSLRRVPALPALPIRRRPSIARQLARPLAITGGVLAGLGGLGFGLYLLVRSTVQAAASASPVALAVLAVVALGVLALAVRSKVPSCSGLHCGGCRGRH